MKIKFLPGFILSFFLVSPKADAQKKVVIMGSSTAAGSGATSYNLSWPGKLASYFNQNNSDGLDTLFINIAKPGTNTYQEMPGDKVPPSGRPLPDSLININKALSYHPNIVIISLPSNDVGEGYSITETMNNFREMYRCITSTGAFCYITTPQPRNDFSVSQRVALTETIDSINAQFGLFAINFWDDLVTADGLNMLRDDRRDLSGLIHPNNLGHEYLFQRVQTKNIFGNIVLKVAISGLEIVLKNNAAQISWQADQQEPNTIFEIERSVSGNNFVKILSQSSTPGRVSSHYEITDIHPLPGKSFYRIKVITPAETFYSNITGFTNKNNLQVINKLYTVNGATNLIANIQLPKNEMVQVSVINVAGVTVQQQKRYITMPETSITIPIINLPKGQYFLKIDRDENEYSIKAFIK